MSIEPSMYTILGDYLDAQDYEKSLEISLVKESLEKGKEAYAYTEELYHDIFMLLQGIDAKNHILPPSMMEDGVRLNHRIIEELSNKDMVDNLRLQNRGLYFNSAIEATSILDTIIGWIGECRTDSTTKGESGAPAPNPDDIINRLSDQQNGAAMENLVSKGLEKASIMLESENGAAAAIEKVFGGGLSEEFKFNIAQRMSREKGFALIIGMIERLRSVAHDARRKKFNKKRPINRGYEYSNDLERTLPVELSLLRNQASRPLFYKKYHEGMLQCIRYMKTDMGKLGPIIACIDNSGSMKGMPEAYSKALMILLFEQAVGQKRPFIVIHFSSRGKTKRFDFEAGRRDHGRMVDAITFYSGGKTDFETPLKEALDIVVGGQYANTDVIFVSDGFSDVSPEFLEGFLEMKRACDINVIAVGIREGAWKRHTLDSFSDCTIALPDIYDEALQNRTVEELFINMG